MRRFFPARVRRFAVAASLALLASPALARPTPAELSALFSRGDYLVAASAAEAVATADDLAFAARALLAHCMTGTEEPEAAIVERAAKDAETALKLDPDHEEGRLQLAIALSLKSRRMDIMAAWSAGYGERGRKLAEEVLQRDPDNFYAHGFLAVWNIEVERRGGGVGAWVMDASVAAGRGHYETASRLAPDDIGVHWQYARALVALDARKNGVEASRVLARALGAEAGAHVEQVMQARAAKLAEALKGDTAAAQRLAVVML